MERWDNKVVGRKIKISSYLKSLKKQKWKGGIIRLSEGGLKIPAI